MDPGREVSEVEYIKRAKAAPNGLWVVPWLCFCTSLQPNQTQPIPHYKKCLCFPWLIFCPSRITFTRGIAREALRVLAAMVCNFFPNIYSGYQLHRHVLFIFFVERRNFYFVQVMRTFCICGSRGSVVFAGRTWRGF